MHVQRKLFKVYLVISFLLLFIVQVALASNNYRTESSIHWIAVESHSGGVSARVHLADWDIVSGDNGQRIELEGEFAYDDPLPRINTWVTVPDGHGLSAEIIADATLESTGLYYDGETIAEPVVEIGEPAIFRGIRLFPVTITPAIVAESGEIMLTPEAVLDFRYTDNDDRAPSTNNGQIRVSSEMRRFIEGMVLNTDELNLFEVSPVGRLLIVADDLGTIPAAIEPYIQWKREQGYIVEFVTTASNTNPNTIKSLITTSYTSTNPIPLEYVLLIGDADGTIALAAYNSLTDHWYSQLEGNDILGDVAIGRFSVRDLTQLRRVVGKTLAYERDVYMTDTEWLENAALAAGDHSGETPVSTNQSILWMLQQHDIPCDTMWWNMYGGNIDDDIPDFLVEQINEGAHFINYRGYYGASGWSSTHANSCTNGSKLPIFVMITCGTGTWATQTEAQSEGIFRAGSNITTYKCGVASIGTATTGTHTRFNNVLDCGIFEGILMRNIRSLGWALVNGKYRLYQAYNGIDNSGVTNFTNWNNLMGDPALRAWINVPQIPDVEHIATFASSQNFIDVNVDFPDGIPELAWATIVDADNQDLVDVQKLDANGYARLNVENPASYSSLTLTVVGDNVVPYQAEITQDNAGVYIAYDSAVISCGTNNTINPGETVSISLTVRNNGVTSNAAYIANVTSLDPRLTVVSGNSFTVPPMAANSTFTTNTSIGVDIAPWAQDGGDPSLTLTVDATVDQVSAIPLDIVGWTAVPDGEPQFQDGDNILSLGETTHLVLAVENIGSLGSNSIQGTLSCNDPGITISDNTADYPSFVPGTIVDNSADPFEVYASDDPDDNLYLGKKLEFLLELSSGMGAVDSVYFTYHLGEPAAHGAVGPDNYGYYALDNSDDGGTFSNVPEYDWVDITTIGTRLNINDNSSEDDESSVVMLPFDFTYYGEVYDRVTICSNGWIAFGNYPHLTLFRNWPIPNPMGPPAMVAVYWDDLLTSNGGGVYVYHDEALGRYIIQWETTLLAYTTTEEVFEIILYDPSVYPTLTGNAQMLLQYNNIQNRSSVSTDNDYATVGIESPDQQDGIQYYYCQNLATGAAALDDGLAILFTDYLGLPGVPPEFGIDYPEGQTEGQVDFVLLPAQEDDAVFTVHNEGGAPLIWSATLEGSEVEPLNLRARRGWPMPDEETENSSSNENQAAPVVDKADKHLQTDVPGPPATDDFGGPDAFGYSWKDSREDEGPEFEWFDNIGEEITIEGDIDDGFSDAIELPFEFPFYGIYYDEMYVCSNGFITFHDGQTPSWQNRALPTTDDNAPEALVAVWWDDLNLEEGGSIHMWTNNTDSVIVTFNEMIGWGPRGGPYTYQAVLKSNGTMIFNYLDMGEEDDERHDEGTIGIQNEDRTVGLTVIHSDPTSEWIVDNLTVKISLPVSWLTVNPASGVVPINGSQDFTLTASSTNLPLGEYAANLVLHTNDPENASLTVPVIMTIIGGGTAPVVADIPDQTVIDGVDFDVIDLDEYVTDENYPTNLIQWSASGNTNLDVSIVNHMATINPIDPNWSGSETLTFTASNPENLTDSDDAEFTITFVDDPPTPFVLLSPEDRDTVESWLVDFSWTSSTDPDGYDIAYELFLYSSEQTVSYSGLTDTTITVDLDTTGMPLGYFQLFEWWVVATDETGSETECSAHFEFRLPDVSVEEVELPEEFAVAPAFPNPFNPSVSIQVALPENAPVKMVIHDILGRQVAQFHYGEIQAGYKNLTWNATNHASGVYFLTIDAGPVNSVQKVLLLK